jgi:hypothetical protein
MRREKGASCFPRSFTYQNSKITDPKTIAMRFNEFFIGVGKSLATNFTKTDNFKNYLPKTYSKFKFAKIGQDDIERLISKMKSKKSSGFDEVSNHIIKNIKESISRPLMHLINDSLTTGDIPDQLKIAKVIPLYKAGDPQNLSNYRPISLLSVFSKIYEKITYTQLYSYCEDNIFSYHQFGFRKASQTTHCVLNFLNNIQQGNKDKFHIAVFLDLKKAFETVDHQILLQKLEHYGLGHIELKWFNNYLSKRHQRVSLLDKISDLLEVDWGVPQGSILGPLLFLIFISDMPASTKLFSNIFADDTTYQTSANDLTILYQTSNLELENAGKWFNDNHLTVHPSKTKYINFGNPPDHQYTLKLGDHTLERIHEKGTTKTYKFLGLLVDENLNWKHHVNYVNTKITRVSFHLMQIRKQISIEHKLLIYNGLIKPHLEYGLQIWGGSTKTTNLTKTNKKIIRITCQKNKFAHVEPLLKEHNILQIADLYSHKVLSSLHNIWLGKGPQVLPQFYNWNDDTSRRSFYLRYPTSTSKLTYNLPTQKHPEIWNNYFNKYVLDLTVMTKPTKLFNSYIKENMIFEYMEKCTEINCYSCKKQPPNLTLQENKLFQNPAPRL